MNHWPARTPPFADALDEIVFASRLLGSDPQLVLVGGGNTSIKATSTDALGAAVDVIHVKGSGWDLGSIEREGFATLRRSRLREIAAVDELSDSAMMNELRQARLDGHSPDPSVEALLHELLPGRVVMHSHADAMIAVMNQSEGRANAESLFGDDAVLVPYVMPGFDLAKLVRELWSDSETKKALVLMNHGLFTFGDTAEEAYDLHIALVQRAADFALRQAGRPDHGASDAAPLTDGARTALAAFRRELSERAGTPMLIRVSDSAAARDFARSTDVSALASQGPATPDHVIRTKRLPLIGRDLAGYASSYESYFEANENRRGAALTALDPAPRVVLDPEWGLVVAGRTVGDLVNTESIYQHTIDIIMGAQAQSGYSALPAGDIFDVEYWELEQAKLRLAKNPGRFAGEVALVTGAASGIGRAIAGALLAEGAAVVGLDLNPEVVSTFPAAGYLGIRANVADAGELDAALSEAMGRFGGLDILVPAAGIFPTSAPIAEGDAAAWERTFAVNVTGIAHLFKAAHPLLAEAPNGGRVVLVASKNVAAPGPGASAYSSSKAAAVQLARVAALEWAPDGIRVNIVHPDAVFDTALWTPELLEERARKYGVSVEDYKRRNLLGVEIRSTDVAAVVVELSSSIFRATTGAQLPVDGGNERVI